MEDKSKLVLGLLVGAAVGVVAGMFLAESDTGKKLKGALDEEGEKLLAQLKKLAESNKDAFAEIQKAVSGHVDAAISEIQQEKK